MQDARQSEGYHVREGSYLATGCYYLPNVTKVGVTRPAHLGSSTPTRWLPFSAQRCSAPEQCRVTPGRSRSRSTPGIRRCSQGSQDGKHYIVGLPSGCTWSMVSDLHGNISFPGREGGRPETEGGGKEY